MMVLCRVDFARRDGLVCAGQGIVRTVSVAVRVARRLGAREHGHIADSVVAANTTGPRLRR
jgi:hypothetical protein